MSLPMWGEWIEIGKGLRLIQAHDCLSPCGESGLKFWACMALILLFGLSPCGESGLKSTGGRCATQLQQSLPMWGEWIEMCRSI